MPSRKLHNLLNKLLLQDSFSWVSGYVDEPFTKYGRRHRALRHDSLAVLHILKRYGIRASVAVWLHLLLDEDKELQREVEAIETLRHDSERSKGGS